MKITLDKAFDVSAAVLIGFLIVCLIATAIAFILTIVFRHDPFPLETVMIVTFLAKSVVLLLAVPFVVFGIAILRRN